MSTPIIFDIETGPLPDEQLERVKPEFKPDSRLKDPDKIKADLEAKAATWKDRAALSAVTGRVICIGTLVSHVYWFDGEGEPTPEHSALSSFWKTWHDTHGLFVGFNIKAFDLPFLVRRSWILGVPVPSDLFDGRYFSRRVVDLFEVWNCFQRQSENESGNGSLNSICKALGIGEKSGSGADFARLWKEDKAKAIAYLENDLKLTHKLAQRMGVI